MFIPLATIARRSSPARVLIYSLLGQYWRLFVGVRPNYDEKGDRPADPEIRFVFLALFALPRLVSCLPKKENNQEFNGPGRCQRIHDKP